MDDTLERAYQCPVCEEWYLSDGLFGFVPHVLSEHPFSGPSMDLLIAMDSGKVPERGMMSDD